MKAMPIGPGLPSGSGIVSIELVGGRHGYWQRMGSGYRNCKQGTPVFRKYTPILPMPAVAALSPNQDRSCSAHHARIPCRPVDKDRFSVDQAALYRPELAVVGGDRAVVAHHEIGVVRNHNLRHGAGVAILFRDVILNQWLAI